ncbi:MAG: hypothetical protein D6772_04330 [Bacteroidetes bacterium]|nr:MAG: hypothetical protein D6772_04330 [Bacteroidota bacterium]
MKHLYICCLTLSLSIFLFTCHTLKPGQMKIEGTLAAQGFTSYQYGTHTLGGYALRSSTIDLDQYVDLQVEVIGRKVDGYPLEGGPELIEVERIKVKKEK